jgi:multidrug resistance efflux pump
MMESRSGGPPTGGAPPSAGPQLNGRAEAPTPPAAPARRGVSRVVLFPVLALVVIAIAGFGYRTWYNSTHYVWTDNAQVAGSIIQVGALNAGQVTAVLTDVGQTVQQGQAIARVSVPQTVAATASGAPKLGFNPTDNQVVDVTSPLSGNVVARMADPGSTVAPGQAIVAVVDPSRLYIQANVNETDVDNIHVGEPVDVTVDSLNVTLPGRVEAITPASAASFSLIPQSNTSGSYSKVVQVVPVRIAVDYGNLPLIVGSSVEVNIHIR